MDGISLLLVVLTTILISLSLLYSGGGDIDDRPREFCFFMLVLETGLLGALLAVDLFLFYVFWELMLVPMYFLIGIWGHGRKIYAAFKFVLYTMTRVAPDAGRDPLPGADDARAQLGHLTFDLPDLYNMPLTHDRGALAVRRASRSPSRSRCRCGRCTPGCPTRIPRRRPRARSSWRA